MGSEMCIRDSHYAVDMDNCQRCWACFQACPTGAIDFRFEARAAFKLLVADSDPSTGQNFEKWLKDENFPLITAKTGAEALQILSEDSDFHLLLLDAGLPDIAMEDMITRIIETHPGVRVALMAEPEEMEAAQRLTAVGVQDVVAKPLEEKKVIPWLDKTYLTMEYYRELTLEAGAVILTAGFECFNPRR